MVSVQACITVALLMFLIGAVGVVTRRNAIIVFMCIELMLNAVNICFVAFSSHHGNLDGQMAVFFVMVVAAAEAAVGLGIIISLYRAHKSVETSDAIDLRL
jgi:NADH-quinone oxidoreductase subunit K